MTRFKDSPDARRSPTRLAAVVGLASVVALLALVGWLGYQQHAVKSAIQQRNLFLETGKQAATNLTTIDFATADADIARILDSTSGAFHDDFKTRSGPFIDVVRKTQSKSAGKISEAAIESINGNTAQLLIAVNVETKTTAMPQPSSRAWRMRIAVERNGDSAKVTKVDFVA
jgi:Mce-associated membrane protein